MNSQPRTRANDRKKKAMMLLENLQWGVCWVATLSHCQQFCQLWNPVHCTKSLWNSLWSSGSNGKKSRTCRMCCSDCTEAMSRAENLTCHVRQVRNLVNSLNVAALSSSRDIWPVRGFTLDWGCAADLTVEIVLGPFQTEERPFHWAGLWENIRHIQQCENNTVWFTQQKNLSPVLIVTTISNVKVLQCLLTVKTRRREKHATALSVARGLPQTAHKAED